MSADSAPAPIPLQEFHDLWIHTGTACNLSCAFCHEGSKPGDARLEACSPLEVLPLLQKAARLGARRFVLTGGEPLILKGIQELLAQALQLRPVLVLTNGTAPWIRRTQQLATLRAAAHPLSFRVSLDTPDEAAHDAQRGFRNFRKALEGLKLLHAAGFEVGITRQLHAGEDAPQVALRFRQLLRKHLLPENLSIVALPQLGSLQDADLQPLAAPGAITARALQAAAPLCARGRMLIRRDGELRLTACALVDDEAAFDRPAVLEAALAAPIIPVHRRCGLCLGGGVNYVGTDPGAGV